MSYAQHLTILDCCGATTAPSGHMIGIHTWHSSLAVHKGRIPFIYNTTIGYNKIDAVADTAICWTYNT